MNFLGVDYGERKIGLAISSGKLADPFKVIRYEDEEFVFEEITKIIDQEKIDTIIVGLSEGKMQENAKRFGQKLALELRIEVRFEDETLSTQDAQSLSIESGMSRKKRKSLEDAFAATLILQKHLDSLTN